MRALKNAQDSEKKKTKKKNGDKVTRSNVGLPGKGATFQRNNTYY